MKAFKIIVGLFVILLSVTFLNDLAAVPGVIIGGLVFTAPGGAGVPFAFNMNYLPQFLTWNNVVPLTSLRVETQEDGVLHDLTAACIAAINGYMTPGAQAANVVVIRLANGQIKNKNVTISGVTSAAGAIGFFETSDQIGTAPFQTKNAAILAANPTTFENFTAIFVPTMAAGDRAEIQYREQPGLGAHRQTCEINDLAAVTPYFQQVPQILVNNVNSYIKSVTFTCAAATPAYILSVKI